MMLSRHYILGLGFFAYIVSVLINLAVAGATSREVFPAIRLLTTITTLICIISYFLFITKINRSFVISVLIILFLYSLGSLYNLLQSGDVPFIADVFFSTLLVLSGVFYFCHIGSNSKFLIAFGLVILSVFVILILYASRGLVLSPIPRFVFDLSTTSGSERLYSQGLSKFFGISSIMCFWLTYNSKQRLTIKILYILLIVFCVLSFIGGARGDFIVSIITIFIMGLSRGWRPKLNLIFLSGAIFVIANYFLSTYGESMVAISRMQATLIGGDLGMRDTLLNQSLQLLGEQPRCFLLGCGYVFFQNYFDYPYGFYPHNIIAEALITWGIWIILPLSVLFLKGVSKIDRNTPYFWLGLYMVLVGLKSGDIINSWLALSFVISVSGIGLSSWVSQGSIPRHRSPMGHYRGFPL